MEISHMGHRSRTNNRPLGVKGPPKRANLVWTNLKFSRPFGTKETTNSLEGNVVVGYFRTGKLLVLNRRSLIER
jgi:hypothetical protein